MSACPCCGGPAALLGSPGYLRHFRCVSCGMQISRGVQARRRLRFPRRVLETCTLRVQPDGSVKPEPNF